MQIFILLLLALQLPPGAVAAVARPIERDRAALVQPESARVETLLAAETIFEGPTWVPRGRSGFLIFSDVPGNLIRKLDADGTFSVFAADIFRGRDTAQAPRSTGAAAYSMVGPNGTTLDRRGRVVYCAFGDGEIVRIDRSGKRTVLASGFSGKHFNAPNDLVYASDGSLYFTDSGAATTRGDRQGLPRKGLYVLRNGHVRLLSDDIDHPNGVALSPDERYLYVSDTRRKTVLRFELRNGSAEHPMEFVDMSGDSRAGGPDGLKVDQHGTLYVTGPGGVWITSSTGEHIGTIVTPGRVTNLAFGGENSDTLYLTGIGALYRVHLR